MFVAVSDSTKLSGLLTRLTRVAGMFVWAPKTTHYFKSRPVFVQSVPKSGTHVVFECLKAFGYAEPPSLDLPHFDALFEDGVFYNLQHMPISRLSPPYQRYPGFFDSLARSVTVFIVRDPRDTAVSLAHYLASQTNYHITTALFRRMPTDERVSRVITGEYPIPIYLNRYLESYRKHSRPFRPIPHMVARHISQCLAIALRGYYWSQRWRRYRATASDHLGIAARTSRARPPWRLQ